MLLNFLNANTINVDRGEVMKAMIAERTHAMTL